MINFADTETFWKQKEDAERDIAVAARLWRREQELGHAEGAADFLERVAEYVDQYDAAYSQWRTLMDELDEERAQLQLARDVMVNEGAPAFERAA